MIRSILTQISRQPPDKSTTLTSFFSSHQDGGQHPTAAATITALQQLFQESGEVFIILDALDECIDRVELLNAIEEIQNWKFGNLHLLVTSRKEKDIQESLEHLLGNDGEIDIQSALVDHDIRAYVQERLSTDRGLKRWQTHPEVQDEIEKALMKKAARM